MAFSDEGYGFTWRGKKNAQQLALKPSFGTLRPAKEESVDWDSTENLFIEGDNIDALKLLQDEYAEKVKMIYIDPPYNTGKSRQFKDKFTHSEWLNMMYPRLMLARDLLKQDGVIFISIDDREVANLRKICDEIFGEENFICSFMWKRKKEISSDSKNVATQGEYIVTYAKSNNTILQSEPLSTEYVKKSYKDPNEEFPLGKWRPVPLSVSKGLSGGGYKYKITTPSGTIHDRLWAYPEKGFRNLVKQKRIYWGLDKAGIPQRVIYIHESHGQPTTNYWSNTSSNKEGKKTILELFGDNYFDTPKPIQLIKRLCNLLVINNDLVLDFFAGSCTTAHAVINLNKEDGGNRKFIMVQLPEPCNKKSEAYKAGYKTIADIGKERIRRVINKIQEENPGYEGDLGFKVFKLDIECYYKVEINH